MGKNIPEHRIQCSYRILIGPLDELCPSPLITHHSTPEPASSENMETRSLESMQNSDNTSPLQSSAEHVGQVSTQSGHPSTCRDINNTNIRTATITTDFTTSQCNMDVNDTAQPTFLSQLQTIDPASAKSTDFESTISETCAKNATVPATTSHYGEQQRCSSLNNNAIKRPVLWRKSGPVFVPPLPNHINSNRTNTVIKHDVLLCNQLVYSCDGKQPAVYKQSHTHTSPSKRQENWRQLEVVLTPDALKCYASSGLVWPKRTVQYYISLDDEKDSNLSLYLLSPLDYTFCLQYTPINEKNGMALIFRARSLTLCQQWYMALYQQLPDHAKKPTPHECKIYIPSINISVHLPLIDLQQTTIDNQQNHGCYDSQYFITMDHVKEAVMDLLENDKDWQQAVVGNKLDPTELALCWICDDRAEWIFWKNSIDGNQAVNMALCSQNIEKTHQLELRPVQHTPHTITLDDDAMLKEPYPREGFLTMITNFEGQIKTSVCLPKQFYFASFDGFLFVIPKDKAMTPSARTYVDPKTLNNGLHFPVSIAGEFNNPLVAMVTPFTDDNSTLIHGWQYEELTRRMKLVANAVGFISLMEIATVRRSSDMSASTMHYSTSPYHDDNTLESNINEPDESISSGLAASSTSLLARGGPSSSAPLLSDRIKQQYGIDLVMENGVVIKLQAYSSETRDQWISGLSELVLYSKARLEADRYRHDNINTPPPADSTTWIGEKGNIDSTPCRPPICDHRNSKMKHSFVDTRIWSLCHFTQCRDVAKSGILYVQSKGVFSRKQFILMADGRLHYFNVYKRSGDDGSLIETGIHNKKGTLDMANAYVYSGIMSIFDNRSPQQNQPPRFFDNGIATTDSDENCLFTIWIPERRRIFSPRRQSIITYRSDRRFNSTGQCWLFMAPNRHDKEEWVWTISIIQEKLLREVNVKSSSCLF